MSSVNALKARAAPRTVADEIIESVRQHGGRASTALRVLVETLTTAGGHRTAEELADEEDVGAFGDLGLEGGARGEGGVGGGGAEIGEAAELLADAEEAGLGPLGRREGVELVIADGAEQDGIGAQVQGPLSQGRHEGVVDDQPPAAGVHAVGSIKWWLISCSKRRLNRRSLPTNTASTAVFMLS